MTLQINFRVYDTPEGIKVDSAFDPDETPGMDRWSNMGTYETIEDAAREAGQEIAYQVRLRRQPAIQPLHLSIPDDQWLPNAGLDDPRSGLVGPDVVINGVSMHVEAWEVTDENDADGVQQVAPVWEDEYAELHSAVHADGGFQTLRIGDRNYVVVISPHCS